MPSRFKNDMGVYFTSQLFMEKSTNLPIEARTTTPVFSLYGGYEGVVDCRKTFLELRDPTGWKWVQEYLDGDWILWKKLIKAPWFKEAFDSWNDELDTLLQSEAQETIRGIAEGTIKAPQATRFQAAKYLDQGDYKQTKKVVAPRGRPSKEEVQGEMAKALKLEEATQSDLNRIGGLSILNGGKN